MRFRAFLLMSEGEDVFLDFPLFESRQKMSCELSGKGEGKYVAEMVGASASPALRLFFFGRRPLPAFSRFLPFPLHPCPMITP